MNELKVFNFNHNQVRTTLINNEPYFCLKDVCDILEIKNISDCKSRLNQKGVVCTDTLTSGGMQKMNFINESNLYKTIFQSRKPEAERFTEWVTSEVLPTIRKTGAYHTPATYKEALLELVAAIDEKEKLEKKMIEDKPKVEFYEAVANSKTAIPMDQVAKVLNMQGIGRNKLFDVLRNQKILQKNNIPYQKYVDCGYFRVVESKYTKPNGETCISIKTLVYQKGVDYIRRILQGKESGFNS